jgi:transcriptional regulator with XRE-family HTH domain
MFLAMPDQPDAALGARLKKLRERCGFTQEKLALEARVTVSTLSRIERGLTSPRWATVTKLANAMNVSLSQLSTDLDEDDEEPEPDDQG